MYSTVLQIVNHKYVFFLKNLSSSLPKPDTELPYLNVFYIQVHLFGIVYLTTLYRQPPFYLLIKRLYKREFGFLSVTVHVILFLHSNAIHSM